MLRRQLFFDTLARSANTKISLGPVHKDPRSPLLGESQPWDASWLNTYPTVVVHGARYKLWYNAVVDCGDNNSTCPSTQYRFPASMAHQSHRKHTATLYAESEDGVIWNTPALHILPWGTHNLTANNLVLSSGSADNNRGVLHDVHEQNISRRFKAFGFFGPASELRNGSALGTMMSADGISWHTYASVDEMSADGDTANQLVYDESLGRYLAFTRIDCASDACGEHTSGKRRAARSVSRTSRFDGGWERAQEVAHGTWRDDELYSLAPWRLPEWRVGLYMAIASYYNSSLPATEGYVRCRLLSSSDHGASWQPAGAPDAELIPLGSPGSFDDHTCYAAPPLRDPSDPGVTRLYYAGGSGPHSGPRADSIGLAPAPTDGLVGVSAVANKARFVTTAVTAQILVGHRMSKAHEGGGCLRMLVQGPVGALLHVAALTARNASQSGSTVMWQADARVPSAFQDWAHWLELRGAWSSELMRAHVTAPGDMMTELHVEMSTARTMVFAYEACRL